jgi:hypothetical protein
MTTPSDDAVPVPPPTLPPPALPAAEAEPHRASVLGFCLLVAFAVLLGSLARRGFHHAVLDALDLWLLGAAISAFLPAARHGVGEALVGAAAVTIVLPFVADPPLTAVLEIMAAATLLGLSGMIQLERHPLGPVAESDDGVWTAVTLGRLVAGLLLRRGRA